MNTIPWRRILPILAFLLIALVLGFLLYLAFFASGPATSTNDNGSLSNGQLPSVNGNVNRPISGNSNTTGLPVPGTTETPSAVANGGKTIAKTLIDTTTAFTTLAGNGTDLLFYDPVSGKFYQTNRNGTEKRILNDQVFKGVENVAWSTGRDKAVLTFADGSNIIYDFLQKKQVSLPSELQEFSFSPDSTKLAAKYIGPSEGDNWLAVINSDGTQARSIEPLGNKEDQVIVNWSPNGQILATYQQSIGSERQQVVPLGQNDENFKTIETDGRGFIGQWDRTGVKMLYSVHSSATSYNPDLYIVQADGDSIGQNNVRLGVRTWADRCAFSASGTNIYCAVPLGLSQGAGLYPEIADNLPYEFMKIDLATGSQSTVAFPTDASGAAQYSVRQVRLSAAEDSLYFTDADGHIRTLQLR
jgi:hypothetical protein